MAKQYRIKKMLCLLSLGVAVGSSQFVYAEELRPQIVAEESAVGADVENGINLESQEVIGNTDIVSEPEKVGEEAPEKAQEIAVEKPQESVVQVQDASVNPNAVVMEEGTEGPVNQRITGIALEGVHSIETDSLMELIQSRPGDIWSPEQANNDIQALLATGYFQAARMKYDLAPEGAKIIYEVKENPPFKGLALTGNTLYETKDLEALATVTPGVIINTNRLAGDLQAIEDFYKQNGYILARLSDVQMSEDGTVSARVVEGVIEEISIKGNEKTKDHAIRREIKVKVGEPLQSDAARNSIRRLNNLGIFEDVKMNLLPGREPSQYVYEIEVKEAPSRSIGLGGGYNEDDGFSASLEFIDKNFMGITDQLKLRYEYGGQGDSSKKFRHGFEVGYVHPWLTSKEMSLSVNLYSLMRRKIDRGTDGEKISEYDRETRGFDITFTQPYGEYKRAFLGIGMRDTRYDEHVDGYRYPKAYIDNNFGSYNSLSLGYIYDDRDNYFVPTRGKRLSLSASQGFKIAGGDFDYTQINLDARKYWPIQVGKKEHTIAVRLLGGWQLGGDVPASDLLSVGGDTVLKGYDSGQFRGRKMIAATLEYRIPIQQYISVVAFGEIGDAWDIGQNVTRYLGSQYYDNPGFKLRASYGLGVRLNTPLGPLRLDYAFGDGEDSGRFSFGFGASF